MCIDTHASHVKLEKPETVISPLTYSLRHRGVQDKLKDLDRPVIAYVPNTWFG